MTFQYRRGSSVLAFLFALMASPTAEAKPWKAAEVATRQTFKYGAFEARIVAARGSGLISAVFLWKSGSEQPGQLWQEQDFEVFGRDGTYQTQAMTPGKNGEQRTEHVINHSLPITAWSRYFTYRMEWTPQYIAYFVDGSEVRRETDQTEFAKLLNPAQAEAAQLQLSLWSHDNEWSGLFDPSAVPAVMFVNWVQTYSYTPGAGPSGSDFTPLWRDEFNSLDTNRWMLSNWTFDAAINDFVPQNAASRNGKLVFVFTDANSTGRFPTPPEDDGRLFPPPGPTGPWPLPMLIEAETFADFSESTPGNSGDCGHSDVDLQITQDPLGGECNVGWTIAGEWLEYDVNVLNAATFDLTLRLSAYFPDKQLHVEIDGLDASGALTVPANGWQAFDDVTVPGVYLPAGPHTVRVVFDSGDVNFNYLDFVSTGQQTTCLPSSRRYEAETMSATTGGASSGGWNLWSNGSISTTHAFIGGDSIVRVSAYGQQAQNVWPHMIVRVGGQSIGDRSVNSTSYSPYEFFYSAPAAASQQVSISFDNDYYANGQDRNLYLDSVTIEECLP